MKWNIIRTTIIIISIGLAIALLRIILIFFPLFNIIDVVLFGGLGYTLGKRVFSGKWTWGLSLSLPSVAISLHFVLNIIGLSSIMEGIGTGHLIAVVIMPLSACIGIFYGAKKESKTNA